MIIQFFLNLVTEPSMLYSDFDILIQTISKWGIFLMLYVDRWVVATSNVSAVVWL